MNFSKYTKKISFGLIVILAILIAHILYTNFYYKISTIQPKEDKNVVSFRDRISALRSDKPYLKDYILGDWDKVCLVKISHLREKINDNELNISKSNLALFKLKKPSLLSIAIYKSDKMIDVLNINKVWFTIHGQEYLLNIRDYEAYECFDKRSRIQLNQQDKHIMIINGDQ